MSSISLVYVAEIAVHGSVGFAIGWIARGVKEKYSVSIDTEKTISMVILFAYLLSVIVDMISPAYETPLGLHTVMGIIAGYYFKKGRVLK